MQRQPLLPRLSAQAAREVRRNTACRQARTCYDHLAGVAGVQLLDALCQRGWLEVQANTRPTYQLTPPGTQACEARGVALIQSRTARRALAYGCLDWTERRPHLGGALGAAILAALVAHGVIRREHAARTVVLLKPLTDWLDDTLDHRG